VTTPIAPVPPLGSGVPWRWVLLGAAGGALIAIVLVGDRERLARLREAMPPRPPASPTVAASAPAEPVAAAADISPVEPAAATGYCVRCREQVVLLEVQPVRLANGRQAVRGWCQRCGGSVMRFVAAGTSPGAEPAPGQTSAAAPERPAAPLPAEEEGGHDQDDGAARDGYQGVEQQQHGQAHEGE
jgi:hypothetical protein